MTNERYRDRRTMHSAEYAIGVVSCVNAICRGKRNSWKLKLHGMLYSSIRFEAGPLNRKLPLWSLRYNRDVRRFGKSYIPAEQTLRSSLQHSMLCCGVHMIISGSAIHGQRSSRTGHRTFASLLYIRNTGSPVYCLIDERR